MKTDIMFDGSNRREVLSFAFPDLSEDALHGAEVMRLPVVIESVEGDIVLAPGDWVHSTACGFIVNREAKLTKEYFMRVMGLGLETGEAK